MASTRISKSNIARRVEAAVRAVLPRSARIRVHRHDSVVDLVVNGVPIEATWITEGGLRQVRGLLTRRRACPDIVVARRLSPGAREALSAAGVGWVDETGAAEIVLKSLIISRSGHPDVSPARPPRWTPAVLAVAEALLYGTNATVAAAQEATGLSTGSCTYALGVLTELELLSSEARRGRGSARRITNPDELLDAYATAAAGKAPAATLTVGVTWRDIVTGLIETGRRWETAGVDWAATGAVAASVIAPYLTSVTTAEVYVDAGTIGDLEVVAAKANLRPIEGGRLTLIPFPTATSRVLAEEIDGLPVVPWPRVYADLRTTGVRGEEAAEHLLEVVRGR